MPWSIHTEIALVQMQLVMAVQGEVTDSFLQSSQTRTRMCMHMCVYIYNLS